MFAIRIFMQDRNSSCVRQQRHDVLLSCSEERRLWACSDWQDGRHHHWAPAVEHSFDSPCLRPSRLWTLQQMLGRVPSPQDNAYAVPLQQADKVPISTHLQSLNRLSQLAQHLNAFRSLFLVEQHALLQCCCQLLCACIGLNRHLPERSLQGGPCFHLHIQVCLPLTSGTVSSTAAECPLSRLVNLTLWS